MTTDEFKEEMEKLGLIVKRDEIIAVEYKVKDKNHDYYAWVSLTEECVADINGKRFDDLEKQRRLFNAVTQYASTPIKEREPKRYFKYRLKPLYKGMGVSYLTYTYDKTDEFDFYSEEANGYKMTFEENDPILDKVNLEMFDPIRVDKYGRKIKEKEKEK